MNRIDVALGWSQSRLSRWQRAQAMVREIVDRFLVPQCAINDFANVLAIPAGAVRSILAEGNGRCALQVRALSRGSGRPWHRTALLTYCGECFYRSSSNALENLLMMQAWLASIPAERQRSASALQVGLALPTPS